MDEATVSRFEERQLRTIAAAYAIGHEEEIEDPTARRMIGKMKEYGATVDRCQEVIMNSRATMREMESTINKSIGAVDVLTDIIGDLIPIEKAKEFALKYEPPQNMRGSDARKADVDIAGKTAKEIPPPKIAGNDK